MGRERRTELVIFDMDGVLVDVESSWGWVHTQLGINNDPAVQAYLAGKIDDLEFMRKDIALWKRKGVGEQDLVEILGKVPLIPGVRSCVASLKQHSITTAIVSAGLDLLAERLAETLQIDHVIANGIELKGGELTGSGILRVSPRGKDRPIRDLSRRLGVPREGIVSIGNSHFDIRMFYMSRMGIAFNPVDTETREAADVVITEKNLMLILPYVGVTNGGKLPINDSFPPVL